MVSGAGTSAWVIFAGYSLLAKEKNSIVVCTVCNTVVCCREKYMRFSLQGGKCVILESEQAKVESPRILDMHAITHDRSKTLRWIPPPLFSLQTVDVHVTPLNTHPQCNAPRTVSPL